MTMSPGERGLGRKPEAVQFGGVLGDILADVKSATNSIDQLVVPWSNGELSLPLGESLYQNFAARLLTERSIFRNNFSWASELLGILDNDRFISLSPDAQQERVYEVFEQESQRTEEGKLGILEEKLKEFYESDWKSFVELFKRSEVPARVFFNPGKVYANFPKAPRKVSLGLPRDFTYPSVIRISNVAEAAKRETVIATQFARSWGILKDNEDWNDFLLSRVFQPENRQRATIFHYSLFTSTKYPEISANVFVSESVNQGIDLLIPTALFLEPPLPSSSV